MICKYCLFAPFIFLSLLSSATFCFADPNNHKNLSSDLVKSADPNNHKNLSSDLVKSAEPNNHKNLSSDLVKSADPNNHKNLSSDVVKSAVPDNLHNLSRDRVSIAASDNYNNFSSDRVNIAFPEIPVSFYPYASQGLEEQYAHLFFDPLLRWRDEQQLEPRLVAKWENISPGVTRFYLKKNIKFHSGNELTSQDVIWTFSEIQQDPQANLFFAGIDNITTESVYSFEVNSQLSETQVLDYLTHFFVLDAGFYSAHKNKTNTGIISTGEKRVLSGTGPYVLNDYNPATHLQVIRNDHYWQKNEATLALNFIKIKSKRSRLFALLSSDVEIISGITSNMRNSIHFSRSNVVVNIFSPSAIFLTINDTKTAVFKQKEAREAINLAINKIGMLKQMANSSMVMSPAFGGLQEANASSYKPYLAVVHAGKYFRYIQPFKLPKQLSLLVMIDGEKNTVIMADALTDMMSAIGIRLKTTKVFTREDWKKQQFNHDFTLSPWQSSLIDNQNIYDDLLTESYLAYFIEYLCAEATSDGASNSRQTVFKLAKETHKIIPLFFQNQIWAADDRYNLNKILSVNGLVYWDLLKRKTTKIPDKND